MSSSQTVNAYNSILNALCDVRVNKQDLASHLSRASREEQKALADMINACLTEYAMTHERGSFVNDNMGICNWAWQMVNGIDKMYVKGVE